MNIVVLCGGVSSERDVSLCTGSLVANALKDNEHKVILVDLIQNQDQTNFDEYKNIIIPIYKVNSEVPDVKKIKIELLENKNTILGNNVLELCRNSDIVFMALHGKDGEDGKIQALFDIYNIKYTGSGFLGSAITMDKSITKQIFINNKILTPRDIIIKDNFSNITYPLVLKPTSGGSSIGVYIVKNEKELKEKLKLVNDDIICEEFIEGIEYTCGVLNNEALPIVEILPKTRFYDYRNKYQEGVTIELCPAPSLDEEQTKKMQDISLKIFKLLKLDIYARMDFIVDKDKNIYCLEANTLPGMTPTSLLPQEAKEIGIDYKALCEIIIELSLRKY